MAAGAPAASLLKSDVYFSFFNLKFVIDLSPRNAAGKILSVFHVDFMAGGKDV